MNPDEVDMLRFRCLGTKCELLWHNLEIDGKEIYPSVILTMIQLKSRSKFPLIFISKYH